MPEIVVTPMYAAAIAILMAVLSTWVGVMRGARATALGHGGHDDLKLAARRFGNLSEYAAMAILLMLLMELQGLSDLWLNLYGLALVALRLLHPFILFDSMDAPAWKKVGRFVSAGGTAGLMFAAAVYLVFWGG